MQNRNKCAWQPGFVEADSNWDFAVPGACCERQQRRSRTSAPCNAENKQEAAETRECACQAEVTRCADAGRGAKNRGVGMVSIEMQQIDLLYEADAALKAGTLFPELHKPLNGYCPTGDNCADEAQEAAFTLWELRLYLNTHPHDKEALALFRKLCKEEEETSYATAFLTDDCCMNGWDWPDSPWPWEYEANCCRRSGK